MDNASSSDIGTIIYTTPSTNYDASAVSVGLDDYLYRYFASIILPRLVWQNSLDQTHMLRLGPQFSPLFGAMVSVAGMQLPCTTRWPIHFALLGYLHAIHALQTSLSDITKAGCDDRILTTVVLLSVFDV
jgi:hypothetical protein